ncbi:MAG: CPBP family intramembrane glutamic endopeptidase, partial [Pseudomonadota bacterium]
GWLGFGATIARTPVQGDVPFNVVITLDRFLSLPLGTWLGFASVVIIAPIAEEIVYRGILLRRLLATLSVSTAVCASAAVFMLAHLGQGQLLFTFFAGVVFAYIYLKTSSLRYGILAHFLVNLNSAIQKSLVDYQGRGGDTVLGLSLPYIIATLLFLAVLILLLWLSKILRAES